MVNAANQKAKRKRARRRPVEMPVRYIMSIESWNWSYWLGINAGHDRTEPYNDFRHLHLTGKLLRPTSIKADSVQLMLFPDVRYNRDHWHHHKTAHIGTLRLDRGTLTGLFSLPSDALPSVLTMLAAGKFRFVTISSEELRYGKAAAHDSSLEMNIDEKDLPPIADALGDRATAGQRVNPFYS